jgi:hypothetical protein
MRKICITCEPAFSTKQASSSPTVGTEVEVEPDVPAPSSPRRPVVPPPEPPVVKQPVSEFCQQIAIYLKLELLCLYDMLYHILTLKLYINLFYC